MGFNSTLKDFREGPMKKYDPLTYYTIKFQNDSDTKTVRETSRALGNAADAVGIDSSFPRFWQGQADKDNASPERKWKNAGLTAAILYGGYNALGTGGSGSTAASTGGGSTTYLEAGGGSVTSGADGSLAWLNADGSTGAAAGNGGWQWADKMKQGGNMMQNMGRQQQPPPEEVKPSDVEFDSPDYKGDPYAYSSKRLKTGPKTSMRAVMARGAAGADPIDQNGVHMAAIQALTQKVAAAKARVEQLKGKRA